MNSQPNGLRIILRIEVSFTTQTTIGTWCSRMLERILIISHKYNECHCITHEFENINRAFSLFLGYAIDRHDARTQVHDPSVKIATLNMSCSFKVKKHKYRDLSGLFRSRRSSPQVVTTEESKRDNTSIVVAEKKDSTSEVAIFEINRRGSVVPVSRTPHDVKSTISSGTTLTSSHYRDKITALREERSRLETLNELFVKLEDKRPVVKLQDKRAQLEAMEREMHHLLSLRLRRRRYEDREDHSEEEEKIRKNQHLIAYHSKSALIKQRHGHTDDSWSKSTRFARDNIFLKRAVREFRSHTRHSLYTSKRPISTLKAENMETHWNESRAQTHSLVDDASWYVLIV